MTILFSILLACTGAEDTIDTSAEHPCDDVELPDCPPECPDDYAQSCGEPCEDEGDACSNNIGDGRECVNGVWTCSEHAPLEAEGCNWVCR